MTKKIKIKLIDKITLKVFQIGTDKINFKILKMAMDRDGANINKIMQDIGLSKVPVNVRINKLEKVGLINRWRGTGIIVSTELGKDFVKIIGTYQDIVRNNLLEMLKNISEY